MESEEFGYNLRVSILGTDSEVSSARMTEEVTEEVNTAVLSRYSAFLYLHHEYLKSMNVINGSSCLLSALGLHMRRPGGSSWFARILCEASITLVCHLRKATSCISQTSSIECISSPTMAPAIALESLDPQIQAIGISGVSEGPLVENTPKATGTSTSVFQSKLSQFWHNGNGDAAAGSGQPANASSPLRPNRKRPLGEDVEGAATSKSPSPLKKRRREASGYAPPAKYAHLSKLVDIIEPNLIGIFVGFNPGVATATAGHAYAHPSNMFWKLLHTSGITDTKFRPEQDVDLPRLCSMGNTNIVDRPSKTAGELSKREMAAGTPILEEKIRIFRPEAVCIVGKSIWEAIWRWRYKHEIKKDEFRYGWQDKKERMGRDKDWTGAWVFVACATSGLNASLKPHEKEEIWQPFGEWVKKRREERSKAVAPAVDHRPLEA